MGLADQYDTWLDPTEMLSVIDLSIESDLLFVGTATKPGSPNDLPREYTLKRLYYDSTT